MRNWQRTDEKEYEGGWKIMLVGEAEKKYHILNDYKNVVVNGSLKQAQSFYKRYIKEDEDD